MNPTDDAIVFDRIRWRDPISGAPLEPVITARTPAGVPLCGVLKMLDNSYAYPIVDCVARLTPARAHQYRAWLEPLGLKPPPVEAAAFQSEETVDSFGFQWSWNSEMRPEVDLVWRVARRFGIEPDAFAGKLVLDAGAGSGDQSRYILRQGASVLSVDLSDAIAVVARKLRDQPRWFGVQGDVTMLPFDACQFEMVYCEGVIQHTRDSAQTVEELCRVLKPGGRILATHYERSRSLLGRVKLSFIERLRTRFNRWERFKLLFFTGILAAVAHVPLLGRLMTISGVAIRLPATPDFKTTWTNTYDNLGTHAFQRYIAPEEFAGYFRRLPDVEPIYQQAGVIMAAKSE